MSADGFVAVWMALMLTSLVGAAALVVDLGFERGKAAQMQAAADAAALGAAQNMPVPSAVTAQVDNLVLDNVPESDIDWAGCTDSEHLEYLAPESPCVSFDSSFTKIRVKIPTQNYPSLFGNIFGAESLGVSAAAVAQVMNAGQNAVTPFALYTGSGTEACLKTGGNTPEPLCNAITGNFGTLDITQYGNASMKTQQRCGNSQQASRLENNIAIGVDHIFAIYAPGDGDLVDGCGQAGPNTVPTRTGNVQGSFDTGMLHGTAANFDDGGPARFQRGPFPKAQVAGVNLDNQPIWEFIPNVTLAQVPNSCQRATFAGLLVSTPLAEQKTVLNAAVDSCIADYEAGVGCSATPCTGAVFSADTLGTEVPINLADIQQSPRFLFAPEFLESSPGNGVGNFHIVGFEPVFLQRLLVKCTSESCRDDFEPGPWNTSAQGAINDTADAVTAFVLHPNMLPTGVGRPYLVGTTAYVQLVQ